MARIMFEGFEKYGPIGAYIFNSSTTSDLYTAVVAEWNVGNVSGTSSLATVAGTVSPIAFRFASSALLSKNLPANYPTLIFGFRITSDLTATSSGITLSDGGTAQVTVQLNTSGKIEVRRGGAAGTLLATSTQSVIANTSHYIEGSITINSTTGAYSIYLDGVITSLSATGQNTQSSANAYANAITLFQNGISGQYAVFDDFYLFDNTGSANNAVRGDSVVMPLFPNSDNSIQFTNGQGLIGYWWDGRGTSGVFGGGKLILTKITPTSNCHLTAVQIYPNSNSTDITIKNQGVVYADNGSGIPGALLGSSPEVVGMTGGVPLVLTLSSSVSLTAGAHYWLGSFSSSTNNENYNIPYPLANDPQASSWQNVTYGPSPPATAPGMNALTYTMSCAGIVTSPSSNAFDVNGIPPSTTAYVDSSTPGQMDLYNTAGLTNNPTSIASIKLSMWAYKSDTFTRTMDLALRSGSTTGKGSASGFALSTSPAYFSSYFDTDPASGLAWTTLGVNNAKIGCDIAS